MQFSSVDDDRDKIEDQTIAFRVLIRIYDFTFCKSEVKKADRSFRPKSLRQASDNAC